MYRKDFTQLTATELTRLAAGFNHLESTGRIQVFANLHAINFNEGIIHWGPAFLPWHRDFLRKIEIELQNFDAQITLPYWDWTRGDSRDLDTGVWKSFFGGRNNTGGNFDHWAYNRRSNSGGWTLPTLVDIISELRENTYFDYRAIEGGSHVPGHIWTGGTMATGQSPLDPLFYLHHCNLDRLWAIWQKKNPSATQYDSTIGLGTDISPNPNVISLNQSMQIGTTATPASVLDHTTLGFLYERDILLEITWLDSENSVLETGDKRQPNLFISDSIADVGNYPSPIPHWKSPDIWVRNQDPTIPGENPSLGHQVPIVNQVNYLYVRVQNRGTSAANNVEVEAFHCNPGTGMLWPNDFNPMGTLSVAAAIPGGGDVVVGPFLWTPTVLGHECLLAIAHSLDDPSVTSTTPSELDSKSIFYQSVPHGHLVRFENNVGQRNVSPVNAFVGGRVSTTIRIRGGLVRTSNQFEINGKKLPKDTEILVIVPNSIIKEGKAVVV